MQSANFTSSAGNIQYYQKSKGDCLEITLCCNKFMLKFMHRVSCFCTYTVSLMCVSAFSALGLESATNWDGTAKKRQAKLIGVLLKSINSLEIAKATFQPEHKIHCCCF